MKNSLKNCRWAIIYWLISYRFFFQRWQTWCTKPCTTILEDALKEGMWGLCRRSQNTTQHNTTQHNTTQHNTTQHNTTQHNTTQHNTTQHNNLEIIGRFIYFSAYFPTYWKDISTTFLFKISFDIIHKSSSLKTHSFYKCRSKISKRF